MLLYTCTNHVMQLFRRCANVAAMGHSHRLLLLTTIHRLFSNSLTMDVLDGLCHTTQRRRRTPNATIGTVVRKLMNELTFVFQLPTLNTF